MALDDDIQHKGPFSYNSDLEDDKDRFLALYDVHAAISCMNATRFRNVSGEIDVDKTKDYLKSRLGEAPKYEGFKYRYDGKKGNIKVFFDNIVQRVQYKFDWVPSGANVPREVKDKYEEYLDARDEHLRRLEEKNPKKYKSKYRKEKDGRDEKVARAINSALGKKRQ